MTRRKGLERLRYFEAFVRDLEGRHDLRRLGSGLTISSGPQGTRVELREPDTHALRSFLIDARRLFTKGEDTDLAVILREAPKHLPDDAARKAVADASDHFHQLRIRGDLRVVINDQELQPAELTDLMIQGATFHGDKYKEVRLAALTESSPLAAALVRHQVLAFVSDVVTDAIWVASVIRHEDAAGRLS